MRLPSLSPVAETTAIVVLTHASIRKNPTIAGRGNRRAIVITIAVVVIVIVIVITTFQQRRKERSCDRLYCDCILYQQLPMPVIRQTLCSVTVGCHSFVIPRWFQTFQTHTHTYNRDLFLSRFLFHTPSLDSCRCLDGPSHTQKKERSFGSSWSGRPNQTNCTIPMHGTR